MAQGKGSALVSVYDKKDVGKLAAGLVAMGMEILSTGGTATNLRQAGIPVIDVSEYTGFPEMMDGRVKTLHPKVHGGILAVRDNSEHMEAVAKHGIREINLVAVNLYPFEQTIAKPGVTVAEAIEQIDIGGPSMVRSAAKNHAYVTVIVDPGDYNLVLEYMRNNDGQTTPEVRLYLARKAFEMTARYDATISAYLGTLLS